MKRNRGILPYCAGVTSASLLVWSIGCEQIIGLDGPYDAAKPAPVGDCTDGATEECYSGDPALKGIGACQSGTRACFDGSWTTCMGEGTPSIERCAGDDDDCDGNATCSGNVSWVLSFGGAGTDNGVGIAADKDSNVVVAGSFGGTSNFGGGAIPSKGGSDIILFKMDPTGKHLWSKAFGTANADNARGVAVDSAGNIILVAAAGGAIDFGGGPLPSGGSTLAVAKFAPDGQHIWSQSFTGAMSLANVDVAIDGSDNVIFVGSISGSVNFGSGLQTAQGESVALVKLDSSGKYIFSKLFGAGMCCGALRASVAADAQGYIGFAGIFGGTITFGATKLTAANNDIFVAKLSPTGDALWTAQGQAGGNCAVDGAAFDPTSGALVIGGTFPAPSLAFGMNTVTGNTGTDAYVVKFNADGSFGWGKAFGVGGADENGSEVDVDRAGNISFTGRTGSNTLDLGTGNVGPAGLFVLKLNPEGNTIWARTSDAATAPYPDAAIAVDKDGYTLLTRGFAAPFSFGGTNLPSLGGNDLFVIKLGL